MLKSSHLDQKCQVFYGTTFFTTQGKKCGGRPLLSAVPERFPAETAVRCLCCKTDLADPEQLRLHLAVPGCTGPIYAKNAVLPPPRDSDQSLQVFKTDRMQIQTELESNPSLRLIFITL
jgi:hypothetical protein